MAKPSGALFPHPIPVIGPQFCVPYPADLAMVKQTMAITNGNFDVSDVNGNIIFKVKRALLTLRDRRVLIDAAGNPILTLRRKLLTAHERWQAFKGESTKSSDLIFTVKRSSMIQLKMKLHVFLAMNTREEVCDYVIKKGQLERSWIIYGGESTIIVAQVHKKQNMKSRLFEKDHFYLTVYPNIDHAFIVALIVVLDEINHTNSK